MTMTWTRLVSVRRGPRRPCGPKRWSAVTGLALVTAAAISTGGCTRDSSADPAPTSATSSGPSSAVPSATVSPSFVPSPGPSAKAAEAALTVYRKYWNAQVKAQAHPREPIGASLERYSVGSARSDIEATVLLFRQQGIEMRGEPVLAPRVTAVDLGDHPKVSITDCVDSSRWKPVYARNGKSALAPGQSPRVVMDSVAVVSDDRWVIQTSAAHRDRTC